MEEKQSNAISKQKYKHNLATFHVCTQVVNEIYSYTYL